MFHKYLKYMKFVGCLIMLTEIIHPGRLCTQPILCHTAEQTGMLNHKLRADRILVKNSAYKLSQSLLLTNGFQLPKIVSEFLNICSIDL